MPFSLRRRRPRTRSRVHVTAERKTKNGRNTNGGIIRKHIGRFDFERKTTRRYLPARLVYFTRPRGVYTNRSGDVIEISTAGIHPTDIRTLVFRLTATRTPTDAQI